jgi:hypothetical protein
MRQRSVAASTSPVASVPAGEPTGAAEGTARHCHFPRRCEGTSDGSASPPGGAAGRAYGEA